MKNPTWLQFPAILALTTLAACADEAPIAPIVSRVGGTAPALAVEASPATGPFSRIIEGKTGPGSSYALYIPRTWNGDALYYAHGYRDEGSPVDLRDQDQLFAMRDQLGAAGFAVAYSSFSENGFAVKDGVQRTHQLRGLLASAVGGQPRRSYAVGHSLGGGIALELVQTFPAQYSGALLMCGMVGGSALQTQYLGDVRSLADVFFPGRFAGNAISVPQGTVVTLAQVIAAVQSNPMGLFTLASIAQTPLAYVPYGSPLSPASIAFQTLVGSLYGALSFHARGINNVADLVHGASPFGNIGTVYSLGGAPLLPAGVLAPAVAAANSSVTRYDLAPSAANYLQQHFSSTGRLDVPVLTIHNRWDPAVPAFHEDTLLARATAAGAAGNLLQRSLSSFGHCAIPTATAVQGFLDLAGWVSSGVRPAN